jgi:hypothetical protein
MLQDHFNRPHAKKVWYEKRTAPYVWIGPMKGRKMSMPRAQFEREIAAPLSESKLTSHALPKLLPTKQARDLCIDPFNGGSSFT